MIEVLASIEAKTLKQQVIFTSYLIVDVFEPKFEKFQFKFKFEEIDCLVTKCR